MTSQEARKVFDAAAANAKSVDQRANIELCREYFCNPAFRAALAEYVWELNQAAA